MFTGQFDRIDYGLRLMETEAIDRLYISGSHEGGEIDPSAFGGQFKLSPLLRSAMKFGKKILAFKAENTFQNGVATACWLARDPDFRSVGLITSGLHMPRASLVLERTLRTPIAVSRLAIESVDDNKSPTVLVLEFSKFIGTWIITNFTGGFGLNQKCSPVKRADHVLIFVLPIIQRA